MSAETVREIIRGAKSGKEILAILDAIEMPYKEVTDECGYFNVRIPAKDGYIRIYACNGQWLVQKMERVVARYSGIPTFEPSGRRSF